MPKPLQPQRVLCVAPNWVGDSLFFLPAVDALRGRYPLARFDLLARTGIADLLKASGRFEKIHVLTLGAGRWARFQSFWSLRRERYDLAVLFPDSFSMALGAALSGAAVRAGRRGEGRSFLLSRGYRLGPRQRQRHVVDEYLELAEACGAAAGADRQPRLAPSAAGVEEQRRLFAESGIDAGNLIGLCPTSAYGSAKQWPAEHWTALARELKSLGYPVAFFCAPSELDHVRPIAAEAGPGIPVLTPSLAGLAACLAACEAVVANDSGPLHLAAAVGARCLGLYGPVDPKWSAPVSPRGDWLYRDLDCSPCHARVCPLGHHDCLKGMQPSSVMAALSELLKR
jgi:heptosyltransferase-2